MQIRPRRNRKSEAIRNMVQENQISLDQLVQPLFLLEGHNQNQAINSLPGMSRMSLDHLLSAVERYHNLGLHNFILFPVVEEGHKDQLASFAASDLNFYLHAAQKIKQEFPDCCLISDVAMDPYSSDGHDGLVEDGRIVNDPTLDILGNMALAQAAAGFDILGPSDMMDGRVGHIRRILDEKGFEETGIMSYTAKYASAFYGPFRDALDSAPKFGDKKTYQMNPANSREALTEARLDIEEGADFIMVKPALHYLDIIQSLHHNYHTPVACYHVSGECAMLMAACQNGWLHFEKALPETLLCMKRAGAQVIITYFAGVYAEMKAQNPRL
jgi:porphobilinogen synthase